MINESSLSQTFNDFQTFASWYTVTKCHGIVRLQHISRYLKYMLSLRLAQVKAIEYTRKVDDGVACAQRIGFVDPCCPRGVL